MKICILTPRFPFPENGGDVLRINGVARYLRSMGHELILVSLCEGIGANNVSAEGLYDKVISVHHSKLKGYFGALLSWLFRSNPLQCGYYWSSKFKRVFTQVIKEEQPDIYISHLLRMVPYLDNPNLVDRTIVEMTDALSYTYALSKKSEGINLKKFIYNIEQKRIAKYENYVIQRFRKVVLVSQKDISYFKAKGESNTSSLHCYKNGVDYEGIINKTYDPDKICFIGNMRTLQNQDAVLHYLNDIFPAVLEARPNTRLYIVGAEPSPTILKLASSNVIITGYVESIYETIKDACYVIAPIRIAAGVQNKVLCAMAYGLPVIQTELIAKAIPESQHNENCIIAENDSDFVKYGLLLSQNDNERNRLAERGHDMVLKYYSWKNCLNGYEMF